MTIFELLGFTTYIVIGFSLGKFLAGKLGPLGWWLGAPTGFLLSLGMVEWMRSRELQSVKSWHRAPPPPPASAEPLSIPLLVAVLVDCAAGYYLGKLLGQVIGIIGWLYGVPLGFLWSSALTRWAVNGGWTSRPID
jgi:hypothetical protein